MGDLLGYAGLVLLVMGAIGLVRAYLRVRRALAEQKRDRGR